MWWCFVGKAYDKVMETLMCKYQVTDNLDICIQSTRYVLMYKQLATCTLTYINSVIFTINVQIAKKLLSSDHESQKETDEACLNQRY